jgi:hypothetical protein
MPTTPIFIWLGWAAAVAGIALITFEGNPITASDFQALPGYPAYEGRFAAARRKLEASRH